MNKKEFIKRLNEESKAGGTTYKGSKRDLDVIVVEETGKMKTYSYEFEITDVVYNEQDDVIIIDVKKIGQFWM